MSQKITKFAILAPVVSVFVAILAGSLLMLEPRSQQDRAAKPRNDLRNPECSCHAHLRTLSKRLAAFNLPKDHSQELQAVLRDFEESIVCSFSLADEAYRQSVLSLSVDVGMAESLITSRERLPDSKIHRAKYEKHIADMLHWLDVSLEHAESACNAKQGPGNVGGLLKPLTHHGFESPLG